MSDLHKQLSNLSPEKRELLLRKLQEKQQELSLEPSISKFPIQRIARDQPIPLSFGQTRLWFLDQLDGQSAIYNGSGAFKLVGVLDISALEQSLNEIIQRHEVLRTNFSQEDGKPISIIHPSSPIRLSIVDLQTLSEYQQNLEVNQFVSREVQKPFNLEKDQLIRGSLIKLDTQSHILLITMHHIISDAWSIGVFIQEFSSHYKAYSQGKTLSLPPLSIQYADYAAWQGEWLSGERLQSQLNYWKEKLTGIPPLLELPTDKPRPPIQGFKGSKENFILSPQLSEKLKKLSQSAGVTIFMTLLSAFSLLLSRYSRQEDITIGSPIANRNRSEIEPLIGFFVNTLILRVNLEDNSTVKELLKQVRKTCLDAYAHQDIPFEKLVEELKPERNMSHTPLFQVMFVLQNAPMEELKLSGLTLSPIDIDSGIAKFDLSLLMEETEAGIKGIWEYNTDLFEKDTITRMMGHFQVLLEGMVANPQENVGKLPLLTEAERKQILVEWNDTAADYPKDKCIHQLFEEQVERTPNAVAVVYEEQQLTYQELNQKANQLACYLQKLGVKPDTLVGICVERSLEMIIGLLGILKAGGAYVPIDPYYPAERVKYMLEDSVISLLLTQENLVEKLSQTKADQICLDRDWLIIAQENNNNIFSQVNFKNLAYVIYTSGSTGKPKGVMIEHHSLANLAVNLRKKIYTNIEQQKITLNGSLSFDTSVKQWIQIIYGQSLCIIPEDIRLDAAAFLKYLQDNDIQVLDCTPGQLRGMLEGDLLNGKGNLRKVLLGGEAIDLSLWQTLQDKNIEFYNLYGPTENTVDTTLAKIDKTKLRPHLGRPINNIQVYILDKNLQPVPQGVIGELYIGGAGIARGYLNRPELTTEKFIPNFFDPTRQTRLYKTGDLCRYLTDGNIEYIGRIDHQVKIRGFRIELGEIESILSGYPDIRESVVLAREDQPGNKRLVAYLVSHLMPERPELETITTLQRSLGQNLREYLQNKLPDYMIPNAFVLLEKLPLTPNGKIDRKALPTPDYTWVSEAENFVAPQTPQEKTIAQIWSDLLRIDKISIHSNFFELGGDSILTIQVVARANQAGLKITPKQLFEHQTIAELGLVAQPLGIIKAEQGLLTGTAPLTPIQHRFFEQDLPEPYHWNQAVLLEVETHINVEILTEVFSKLLEHHDALRLRFQNTENGWKQSYHSSVETLPIEVINLTNLAHAEQLTAIETQANQWQSSLNLGEGTLIRGVLFKLSQNQLHRLLIIIHHLVVDGVSWRILLEDLGAAYQQLIQGKMIKLPSKTTSYKQWGEALIEYAQSEEIKAQSAYWLKLSDVYEQTLPVDYQVDLNQNTEASSANSKITLSTQETQALIQDIPQVYNTQINDILLTALVQSFAQWTGKFSLLLDLEGHGREDLFEDIDLSQTVGWFTSIFPVKLELYEAESNNLGEAIKSIKEQLRQIPQKGIGYGILRYLSPDELIQQKIPQIPQAQISFNYLGQFGQIVNLSPIIKFASESSGLAHSVKGQRQHLIDINSMIVLGKLEITWTYSEKFHKGETIEKLAHSYLAALQALINHCQSSEAGGFTPSDFPDVDLDQQELDDLLAEL